MRLTDTITYQVEDVYVGGSLPQDTGMTLEELLDEYFEPDDEITVAALDDAINEVIQEHFEQTITWGSEFLSTSSLQHAVDAARRR